MKAARRVEQPGHQPEPIGFAGEIVLPDVSGHGHLMILRLSLSRNRTVAITAPVGTAAKITTTEATSRPHGFGRFLAEKKALYGAPSVLPSSAAASLQLRRVDRTSPPQGGRLALLLRAASL